MESVSAYVCLRDHDSRVARRQVRRHFFYYDKSQQNQLIYVAMNRVTCSAGFILVMNGTITNSIIDRETWHRQLDLRRVRRMSKHRGDSGNEGGETSRQLVSFVSAVDVQSLVVHAK